MAEVNDELGVIARSEGKYFARLSRFLQHDRETIWSMLTEPGSLKDWLAPGKIELVKGGAAKLNFVDSGIVIDSIVTRFDPLVTLEYSWSSEGEPVRPIRFELVQKESEVELILTLETPDDEDMARSCAGWEAHLMMLLAAIEGVPIKFPFERFQSTREQYNALIEAL